MLGQMRTLAEKKEYGSDQQMEQKQSAFENQDILRVNKETGAA
jgi:hypothetical protein